MSLIVGNIRTFTRILGILRLAQDHVSAVQFGLQYEVLERLGVREAVRSGTASEPEARSTSSAPKMDRMLYFTHTAHAGEFFRALSLIYLLIAHDLTEINILPAF